MGGGSAAARQPRALQHLAWDAHRKDTAEPDDDDDGGVEERRRRSEHVSAAAAAAKAAAAGAPSASTGGVPSRHRALRQLAWEANRNEGAEGLCEARRRRKASSVRALALAVYVRRHGGGGLPCRVVKPGAYGRRAEYSRRDEDEDDAAACDSQSPDEPPPGCFVVPDVIPPDLRRRALAEIGGTSMCATTASRATRTSGATLNIAEDIELKGRRRGFVKGAHGIPAGFHGDPVVLEPHKLPGPLAPRSAVMQVVNTIVNRTPCLRNLELNYIQAQELPVRLKRPVGDGDFSIGFHQDAGAHDAITTVILTGSSDVYVGTRFRARLGEGDAYTLSDTAHTVLEHAVGVNTSPDVPRITLTMRFAAKRGQFAIT